MTKKITVFPCGTTVMSLVGGFQGMITAIVNRFEMVSYEITYYFEGELRTVWLTEDQFYTADRKKQTMGFRQQNTEE